MMDNLDDILCVLHKSKDEEEVIKTLRLYLRV
jgi:hypothetical protein